MWWFARHKAVSVKLMIYIYIYSSSLKLLNWDFTTAVITMFSDIKENVFSYKHTRNLRREIKTTGKKEKWYN